MIQNNHWNKVKKSEMKWLLIHLIKKNNNKIKLIKYILNEIIKKNPKNQVKKSSFNIQKCWFNSIHLSISFLLLLIS